jgi:hypothetical protein
VIDFYEQPFYDNRQCDKRKCKKDRKVDIKAKKEVSI